MKEGTYYSRNREKRLRYQLGYRMVGKGKQADKRYNRKRKKPVSS